MENKKYIKVNGLEERGFTYRISIYSNCEQDKYTIPQQYIVGDKNKPLIFAVRTLLQHYVDNHLLQTNEINSKLLLEILNGKIIFDRTINNDLRSNYSSDAQIISHSIDTRIVTQLNNKLSIYSKRIDNKSHDPNKIKEATYFKYKTSILNELIPNFGNYKLQELTKLHIIEWVDQLEVTFKTFRDYIIPLKAIYSDAISLKIIPQSCNLFDDDYIIRRAAEVLPNGMREINPLTWDEIKIIFSAPDTYMKFLILFTCFTGIRAAELVNLKIKNVNARKGVIHIIDQYTGKNVTACKSKDSERDIKILELIEDIIIKQYSLCSEFKQSEYFFFNPNTGTRFSSSTKLNKHITKYLAELGIKRRTCHEFRHTYASIMLQAEDVQWVAGQMGHSTIELLISTYSHILKERSESCGYKIRNPMLYEKNELLFSKGSKM
jgi:integrase